MKSVDDNIELRIFEFSQNYWNCAIICSMVTQPAGNPSWVATQASLQRMVAVLSGYKVLAVDTESNSLYVYREEVCLIQFSTGEVDYLVDPLALVDLSLLSPIFSNQAIEKVFHAAEYDLISMKRDFGFKFCNIFDTMLAGRILGRAKLGLAAMLNAEFGVETDKRYQRANWGKRPLPPDQLAYARLDTHYLIPLRHRLRKALEERKRLPLAQEDFNRLCSASHPVQDNGPARFWRIVGKNEVTPQQVAVLYALYEYREQQAQARNLPVFKVIGNKTLLEVAQTQPRSKDSLSWVFGMTPRQIRIHGDGMLEAVERGLGAEPPQRPSKPQLGGRFLFRLDTLRDWRKKTARAKGVESDVIMPRDILELIAKRNPRNPKELKKIMSDLPWRFEHYYQDILHVLSRKEVR
jgi:ribonuclease D